MYHLIIIDDEEKIVNGMGALFPWKNMGFSVDGLFTSAKKALEFIEENPVDVVLSDIEMPDMNGIALCRQLLEREDIRVILFSSYQNYAYFREAIRAKAEDYLLKPVSYEMLTETLERVKQKLDVERQKKEEVPADYYNKIVAEVRKYLETHIQTATLEEAAEVVSLSPSYLSKIFKEKNGCGFAETLLKLRMEQAKEMLADIHYKSYDIAYYLGYDNPKNFSRAFKSYWGVSPMEFRKAKTGAEG